MKKRAAALSLEACLWHGREQCDVACTELGQQLQEGEGSSDAPCSHELLPQDNSSGACRSSSDIDHAAIYRINWGGRIAGWTFDFLWCTNTTVAKVPLPSKQLLVWGQQVDR